MDRESKPLLKWKECRFFVLWIFSYEVTIFIKNKKTKQTYLKKEMFLVSKLFMHTYLIVDAYVFLILTLSAAVLSAYCLLSS